METITVVKATKKESAKGTYVTIETEDGRVGISSDVKFLELLHKPVEVEVKPGKPFNGVAQFYFNLPKENGGGKKSFPPKDYTSDKRMCALTNAVNSILKVDGKVTSQSVLALSEVYFTWLNTK